MIKSRNLGLAFLAVAGVPALMGCQQDSVPAAGTTFEPAAGSPSGALKPPEKARSKAVRKTFKRDEDSILTGLLVHETVQKDLGMTKEQIEQFKEIARISKEQYREFLAKAREIRPSGSSYSPGEDEARDREFQSVVGAVKSEGKELQKKAMALLTPDQLERLKQIRLQTAIAATLARPEFIKALEISDEQRERIRALFDSSQKRFARLVKDHPTTGALSLEQRRQAHIEIMKEGHKISSEVNKQVLGVLTPEQRAKFEALQGKAVDLTTNYEADAAEAAELGP